MKKIFINDVRKGKEVKLYCQVENKRQSKNNLFLDLYDSTGIIQAVAFNDKIENYDILSKITKESAIYVEGKYINERDEILIDKFEIISLAEFNLTPSPNDPTFDVQIGRAHV